MTRRKIPVDNGFRHPGDLGQGPRFPRGFADSRVRAADASYQGYGAYATLDGSRVDEREYAELDWTGVELEPELRPRDHTGRGPRGYRRSDASIHDELCAALTAHPEIDASHVVVDVANGEVLLFGTVERRAIKRLIEDLAYRVRGVRDVNNLLHIGLPIPTPDPDLTASREGPEPRPLNTSQDDHPSRRDAWVAEHLRDPGPPDEQAHRAARRANLRSHDATGPHDTSAEERLGAPEEPLFVPPPKK